MSSYEYNDLFFRCQSTGIYHVFTFDIKNSKKMERNVRFDAQKKLIELGLTMYRYIQKKEIEENKKILVFEEDFVHWGEISKGGFGIKIEPFIIGDLMGFTVYRNTITNEEIMNIFNISKKILNINFEFNIADGYYETNDWVQACEKYFRSYCIDLLSTLHKPHNQDIKKILNKQKNKCN